MKKSFLAISLVIIFSGCTSLSDLINAQEAQDEVVVRGSYGVAINEFKTFDATLRPKESTTLNFKLSNIGNTTASNVVVRLINYGELILSGDAEITEPIILEPLDDVELEWTVKAPETPGVDFYPLIKMCYDYSSVGYKSVKVIDNEVYSPETVLLESQQASTPGPITVIFEVDNPMILSDNEGSETFRVLFENQDVGQVSTLRSESYFGLANYIDVGDIKIRVPSIEGRVNLPGGLLIVGDAEANWNCELIDNPALERDYYECTNGASVRMINGQSARINVQTLLIKGLQDDGFSEIVDDMYFFEAEVSYQYCLTTDPVKISVI